MLYVGVEINLFLFSQFFSVFLRAISSNSQDQLKNALVLI